MNAYVEKLGWTINDSGVVTVPPNPDNQIESTVVQENIQLPRTSSHDHPPHFLIADYRLAHHRANKSYRARRADVATCCTRCKLVSALYVIDSFVCSDTGQCWIARTKLDHFRRFGLYAYN